jgi:hypothetical protein
MPGGPSTRGGTSAGSTSTSAPATGSAAPIGPPPQKETLGEAQKRIASALGSGDCDKIVALTLAAKSASSKTREALCGVLKKGLAGATPTAGQSFKGLAGVLDYKVGARHLSAVLVRTDDGLYHVAFVDRFESGPTVGTPLAHQFEAAANAGFDALRKKDCDAYLEVVYAVSGVGARGREAVCPAVEHNPVNAVTTRTPSARPKLIGGNGYFAFYGVDGPLYVTLALAREAPSQRPTGLPPAVMALPKGAPEYAVLRAYLTNRP